MENKNGLCLRLGKRTRSTFDYTPGLTDKTIYSKHVK